MSRNTNKYAMMVEWYLFHEKEIRQAVDEARLDVASTRAGGEHPRLRGKDFLSDHGVSTGLGSPPLARERLAYQEVYLFFIGITPAYAGKTPYLAGVELANKDHPRLRGKDR